MLTYDPRIDKVIRQRLTEKKECISKKKDDFLFLLPRFCNDDGKRRLVTTLSNKLMVLYQELWEEETSLQSAIASLRYILEALISSELLCKEDDYYEKVYYGIARHQIEKYELLLSMARNDIELINTYKTKEDQLSLKDISSERNAKAIMQAKDDLYENLDEEFSMFLDSTDYFGLDHQAEYITSEVIPIIEKKITDLMEQSKVVQKELASNLEFNRKFKIKGQATKVSKILSDNRKWKQKAIDAGLYDEYSFVYNYTSSILHCMSFSFLTNTEIEEPELMTFRSLSNKFMNRLFKNLFTFCSVPYDMAIIKSE